MALTQTTVAVVPDPLTLATINGTTVTSSGVLHHTNPVGLIGFYGVPPSPQFPVVGAKGGNVALGSLMTALATIGLVIDGTAP